MSETPHIRTADDALVAAHKRWRMHGPVVLEAEIYKLRDQTEILHLRYFVLYEHVLIYRHRSNGRILGVIPVEILRFCGFPKEDQTGCRFHVILRGSVQFSGKGTVKEAKHVFNLQAKTPSEATVWVTKLKLLQFRYEKAESTLDRRGRYWLKLGKQASQALDGSRFTTNAQDSGSEWEAGEDEMASPSLRARSLASAVTVPPPQESTEFRIEKLKVSAAPPPDTTTLMEGYLQKRLRVVSEVKVRISRSKSVFSAGGFSAGGFEAKSQKDEAWVNRYFTLTDKEFFYGLDRGGQTVGIIPLEVITSVSMQGKSNLVFELAVLGEPRAHTFDLKAADDDSASKWVTAISQATLKFKNVLVDFDLRGLFWLTLASSRRATVLGADITSEECAEINEVEDPDPDEDAIVLSQSGRKGSKTESPPFSSYFTQSSQGFVVGMDKPNQDNYANVRTFGSAEGALFGVFDGHGPNGHLVSAFLRQYLPDSILKRVDTNIISLQALQEVTQGYSRAFLSCNEQLSSELIGKLEFSGSTAIICHLQRIGDQIYLWSSNLGDSRAVLAKQAGEQTFLAVPLSCDHLPTCPAERKRIEDAGGRVGPNQHGMGSSRVWLKTQDVPGLAVARAFGDAIAAGIGVLADPEVWVRTVCSNDCFIILASDGLWEFTSCQEAVDIVAENLQATGEKNAEKAAKLLVTAAELRWAEEEAESRDDITVTVVFL